MKVGYDFWRPGFLRCRQKKINQKWPRCRYVFRQSIADMGSSNCKSPVGYRLSKAYVDFTDVKIYKKINITRLWPICCTPRAPIFSCILLRAFSFLSACIRDPASNWDPFNIILIVTGVEVVIGNCLPEVHKILPHFKNWEKKFSNNGRWRWLPFVLLYLNAYVYLAPLRRYGASKIMGSRPWPFGVTWRRRSRDHPTPGGRLPMSGPQWPCIYLAPLWRYGRLKFFQESSSSNRRWSLVDRRSSVVPQYYSDLISLRYVRNVARED